MCICVRVWYICVFMCIHVCVCTWLHVWTYWYAHICVCIGVCVFPIFIWHFNPSSIFLYIIYIAHCAIILLCTLMLYICDRSTPDLNKDDELNKLTIIVSDNGLPPGRCQAIVPAINIHTRTKPESPTIASWIASIISYKNGNFNADFISTEIVYRPIIQTRRQISAPFPCFLSEEHNFINTVYLRLGQG